MSDYGLLEVQLNNYEGPLDLLIHLIHRNEMNIFDVPISEITEHFIIEVRKMQEMNVEVAADFINMASYLIYLKSRSLLPRGTTVGEEISIEEEGFNLAQALIELAYCKDMALHLRECADRSARYLFRRDSLILDKVEEEYIAEGTIFDLAQAFFSIEEPAEKEMVVISSTKEHSDEVQTQTLKIIMSRPETMWSELNNVFNENFEKAVAFNTVLTMSKQQLIRSVQESNFNDILMKRLAQATIGIDTIKLD